jgi:hypothetical protein
MGLLAAGILPLGLGRLRRRFGRKQKEVTT